MSERPTGSNADEWHIFLSEHLDNRAGNSGLTYMAVQISEAIEYASQGRMFDLGNGLAVNFCPSGRFHGWIFRKHPDGYYVSVRKLDTIVPRNPCAQYFNAED